MIQVVYFANIREKLGRDGDSLEFAPGLDTVEAVIAGLVREHGEAWQQALQDGRVLCAVNQVVAERGTAVADGDEVAFFPPVTGG